MSMTDKLHELYKVDRQLRALQTRVAVNERYLKAHQAQLDDLNTRRAALQQESKQTAATATNLETEAGGIEDKIAKLREQMNQSQTNKQYQAFLTEINTLKADKDGIETESIGHLTRIDELNAQIEDLDAQIAEKETLKKATLAELETSRSEVASSVEELQRRRDVCRREIPPEIGAEYEDLLEWQDGEAMSEVVEEDRRRMEYACGACNMQIPIERVSELLSANGPASRCPSCRRFLFLGSDLRAALELKSQSR
ncbi:MAG: hypothetical protein D8M59_16360 [Planctomycetes bacterium]|nr:hypothetical protein [Planctomycetota bacterium]NOG54322.1 hypothetical protein [Planctomycetota bacterium]